MAPTSRDEVRADLLQGLARLRDAAGYLRAGFPRYHTLFGRDSLVAAWQMLRTEPAIARATLRALAELQGRRVTLEGEEEPGKILHEQRFDPAERSELPGWAFPYYGSVDSTPLYLIVAEEYVRATDDDALLDELWGALTACWRWMLRFGDPDGDGYLEYARRNPHGLFHQGWKDGSTDHLRIAPPVSLVEVQGYAVAAHRGFAALAHRRGERELAVLAARRGIALRGRLNRDFWVDDLDFFALALDGADRPRRAVTSNPGHLLIADAVEPGRLGPLVDRLFQEDMATPYGIRTHAKSEADFDPYGYHTGTVWPHDNWFLYRGLRSKGLDDKANDIREAMFRAREELGGIPELFAVVDDRLVDLRPGGAGRARANPLQAWASAALLDMLVDD